MLGEVEFPFDIKGFTRKIGEMEKSLSSIGDRVEKFGKTVSSSIVSGLLKTKAIVAGINKIFKSIAKNIPEIGQAFSKASEIMTKEFFFPIRQMIMPYLQKMLDWVRDHRALFAKWGTTVSTVLKSVIDSTLILWDSLKGLVSSITDSLQRGLNTNFKSLDEFLNVLSVKLVVMSYLISDAMQSLIQVVQPVLDYVITAGMDIIKTFSDIVSKWLETNDAGDSLYTVIEKLWNIFSRLVTIVVDAGQAFLKGLQPYLEDIMTPIDDLLEAVGKLIDGLAGVDNERVKKAFEWLGDQIGKDLVRAMRFATSVADSLAPHIGSIADRLGTGISKAKGYIDEMIDSLAKMALAWLNPNKEGKSFWTALEKAQDIINDIIDIVGSIGSGLFSGFQKSTESLMSPINNLLEAIQRLTGDVAGEKGSLYSAFERVGQFLGGAFTATLNTLALAIDTIIMGIVTLAKGVQGLVQWGENPLGGVPQAWKDLGEDWKAYGKRVESYTEGFTSGVSDMGAGLFGDNSSNTNNVTVNNNNTFYLPEGMELSETGQATQEVIVEQLSDEVMGNILRRNWGYM